MFKDPTYQIWRKEETIEKEKEKIKREAILVILKEELIILKHKKERYLESSQESISTILMNDFYKVLSSHL